MGVDDIDVLVGEEVLHPGVEGDPAPVAQPFRNGGGGVADHLEGVVVLDAGVPGGRDNRPPVALLDAAGVV